MTIHLDRLSRLQRAEDYFTFFSVDFDPRVLSVYRLRILKRFALEIAAIDAAQPAFDERERARRYASALAEAHAQYARRFHEPAEAGEPATAACVTRACSGCAGA